MRQKSKTQIIPRVAGGGKGKEKNKKKERKKRKNKFREMATYTKSLQRKSTKRNAG